MLMIEKNMKGKQYMQLIEYLSRTCDCFAFVENGQYGDFIENKFESSTIYLADHLIEKSYKKNGKQQV